MGLEQELDDKELLKNEIAKAKQFSRSATKSLILYGLLPGIILIGTSLYLTYRNVREQLAESYQQCQRIDDKMTIRDLPLGRFNCQEIEGFYSKM